ncbi:MAG: hypothetical protein ACRECH_11315 [Nitrososphaerales archaeon]
MRDDTKGSDRSSVEGILELMDEAEKATKAAASLKLSEPDERFQESTKEEWEEGEEAGASPTSREIFFIEISDRTSNMTSSLSRAVSS